MSMVPFSEFSSARCSVSAGALLPALQSVKSGTALWPHDSCQVSQKFFSLQTAASVRFGDVACALLPEQSVASPRPAKGRQGADEGSAAWASLPNDMLAAITHFPDSCNGSCCELPFMMVLPNITLPTHPPLGSLDLKVVVRDTPHATHDLVCSPSTPARPQDYFSPA